MVELFREMPLSQVSIDYPELKINSEHLGVVVIQCSDVEANSPLNLPDFGTVLSTDASTIFTTIPNLWLHICALTKVDETLANYNAKITKQNIVISDMSDQYIVFKIKGDHARNLFAKGCELDLSTDNFKQNNCARTLLAHLNVVIWRDVDDGFKLLIDVSFAKNLWNWLEGAALEYC